MTPKIIEEKLIELEDKCIHNFEDNLLVFLLEDYSEGGYECCIDSSDIGWFISDTIERLNELFFSICDLKLGHDVSYPFFKRIIKCKYNLDKMVMKDNLPVPYYDDVEIDLPINEIGKSIISKNETNLNSIDKLHSTLLELGLVNVKKETFSKCLCGEIDDQITWIGTFNRLALFSEVLKKYMKPEYQIKHWAAICLKFTWKNKKVNNMRLADAYNKVIASTEEEFKAHFNTTV